MKYLISLVFIFFCGVAVLSSCDQNHEIVEENVDCDEFPPYYFWKSCDTLLWIPFENLPFRGLAYDSIISMIGEADFAYGMKMHYGFDRCGFYGCEIAPMFKNDSLAVVNWYTWVTPVDTLSRPPMLVLFFEETRTHAQLDTPIWGYWANPNKVLLD